MRNHLRQLLQIVQPLLLETLSFRRQMKILSLSVVDMEVAYGNLTAGAIMIIMNGRFVLYAHLFVI